ncbi:restriction endonuclease [Lacipirellula sp.]|uniref:restriction endonuclease n=1 Tax=Lacipirellula sp. TaxID=2691419 RepID=UPI003D0F683A
MRRPAESFNLWPLGLILVGGVLAGSPAFVFWKLAGGSYAIAFAAFLVSAGVAASTLAWLLFTSRARELNEIIEHTASRLRTARETGNRLQAELADVRRLLATDTQALDAIRQSLQFQRETLLRENWKAMRGLEWEDFLVRAFRLLGAAVQPTGTSGDQGVDLIATIGPRCYAIQAKGYVSSVGNGAVQEAVAGMAHYRCNACAVITNSRFTASAMALAGSNRCRMIGEDEVPALVLGQLAW